MASSSDTLLMVKRGIGLSYDEGAVVSCCVCCRLSMVPGATATARRRTEVALFSAFSVRLRHFLNGTHYQLLRRNDLNRFYVLFPFCLYLRSELSMQSFGYRNPKHVIPW